MARTVVASRSVVSSRSVVASRSIVSARTEVVPYLLRALFDALDQGYANGQVLDTVAEGIQDGQLTVAEVDGTLAISGNRCAFTAQGTPTWGDLGFYSQAITRALGRGLLGTVNLTVDDGMVGWFNGTLALTGRQYVLYFLDTSNLYIQIGTSADIKENNVISGFTLSTDYQFAFVYGGYHSNGVSWRSGQAAADYLYGVSVFVEGGTEYPNWTLVWRSTWFNDSYNASFSPFACAGYLDNFRVPDADLSAVLQPNSLSLMASAGELSAYTPELGSVWTEDIGDWDTAGGVLQATALGITTFTGLADCLYDAKITMPGAGTTAGGLVVRETDLTGGSEDYWYVKITPGTAGTDWELIEYVNGAATQRASGDVDWAAATAYAIRAICDGQDIACFADGGDKISYASAASGETATSFGLRDEGNANMTFDNVALFARTSSVYEATLDCL